MALIVHPEGTQVSGSIGGTTFSHNRFGSYKRNRSIPVNTNTARQVAVRNAVRSLAIAWGLTLTQLQRDAWEVYAGEINWTNRLGQAVNLTGLNHYVRCNTPRVQLAIARIDTAPTDFELATAELALVVSASEATQQITLDGDPLALWVGEADAWQFGFVGRPQNPGIKFFGGPYKQAFAMPGAGPPPFPAVVPSPWPFAEGQRMWVRTRITRGDGRLSEFAEVNFLAIA